MSEKRNSFKLLEEEQEKGYADNVDRIKKTVDGNLGGLSFITNIIDVYFARVVSYVVNVSGGSEDGLEEGDVSDRAE